MTDANENILYDLAKETNGSVTLSYSGESIKAAIQNICPWLVSLRYFFL